jgi:uncharacterized membrane protein
VHFPIVFLFSAAIFNLVYLATGVVSFETSAFHFLGAGVLSLPLAMLTGERFRRLNYSQDPVPAFRIEIFYSRILLVLSLTAFLWRWLDPHILRNFKWTSLCYLLIILALPVLVTIISFFGGLLTFPPLLLGHIEGGGPFQPFPSLSNRLYPFRNSLGRLADPKTR